MHHFLQSLIGHGTAFSINGFAISWYGLAYVVVFIAAWITLYRHFPKAKWIDWFVIINIISGLIGARLAYIIFNGVGHSNSVGWFDLHQGGLSWHGGLVAMMVSSLVLTRYYRLNLLKIADSITPVMLWGIALVRFTNFLNGELPGTLTNSKIGFLLPGYSGPRHAQQLYEAVLSILILVLVLYIKKTVRLRSGQLFIIALTLSTIARFIVEFFRQSDFRFAFLAGGQVLSILTLVTLAIIYYQIFVSKRSVTK